MVDRRGTPLGLVLSAANVHDSQLLEAALDAVPAIGNGQVGRPRRRREKLHADKGYDYDRCCAALKRRGIMARIARRGVESSERLGRHRWVVERTMACLNRMRRLRARYERRADIHEALSVLGCALLTWKAVQRFCDGLLVGDVIGRPSGVRTVSEVSSSSTLIGFGCVTGGFTQLAALGLVPFIFYKLTGAWENVWLLALPAAALLVIAGIMALINRKADFPRELELPAWLTDNVNRLLRSESPSDRQGVGLHAPNPPQQADEGHERPQLPEPPVP